MQTQIDLFKKLSVKLGDDTANDLVNYISETKENMDDKFLTQKDKVDLLKEISGVRLDLVKEINAVRQDLVKEINAVRQDLVKEINAVRQDLGKEITGVRVDLVKEITEVRKLIDVNFKWGVGMFISILVTLFVLLFKSFN